MCKKNGYTLSQEGEAQMKQDLLELYENGDENFGNARDVRNRLDQAVARQAEREAPVESPPRGQRRELVPGVLPRAGPSTRDETAATARAVPVGFNRAVARQSNRVAQLESPTREQLMELLPEDLTEAEAPREN